MNKAINYANRGQGFEDLIDFTNMLYKSKGIALINKRPTPVVITRRFEKGKIEGRLEKASTVDYDGTYQGRSIVYEAKETKLSNRFPLDNIEDHQFEYLELAQKHGAISFLLLSFNHHQSAFLMPFVTLNHFWQLRRQGRGYQSIPLNEIEIHGYRVPGGQVPVDYIAVVRQVWNQNKS